MTQVNHLHTRSILFIFGHMIAKISSFSNQFKPDLVGAGKAIFEDGKVSRLVKDKQNYRAEVTDTYTYDVVVHVEDGFATAVFCRCGPALCPHVISVLFALQKRLKIKPEPFDPSCFDPPTYVLLGQRLNDIVYPSRAAGSKDGELEELGEKVTLNEPDVAKFKAMVKKGLTYPHEKSRYPILTGAKRLLGKAILKYEEKDFEYVFAIAKAVLTEICSGEMYGNSANECAKAAVEILNTLCADPEVPAKMRKEVFDRVVFACNKDLYSSYHTELLSILTNPGLDKDLQKRAEQEFTSHTESEGLKDSRVIQAQYKLLKQMGKAKELQAFMLANPDYFREELIEQAFARKDYSTVKQLARDGVEYNWPDKKKWKDWLFKIAEIEKDVSYIRSYYKDKYFEENYTEAYYEICRATYSADEWVKEIPGWLAMFKKDQYRDLSTEQIFAVAKIYIREEMENELLALLQEHCSFSLAQLAEPLLLRNHAEALMTEYREWFIWLAGTSTQREPAIHLREMLKTVRRTPAGKKMVKELVPHLLALHPTWKVFGEEISKLL